MEEPTPKMSSFISIVVSSSFVSGLLVVGSQYSRSVPCGSSATRWPGTTVWLPIQWPSWSLFFFWWFPKDLTEKLHIQSVCKSICELCVISKGKTTSSFAQMTQVYFWSWSHPFLTVNTKKFVHPVRNTQAVPLVAPEFALAIASSSHLSTTHHHVFVDPSHFQTIHSSKEHTRYGPLLPTK